MRKLFLTVLSLSLSGALLVAFLFILTRLLGGARHRYLYDKYLAGATITRLLSVSFSPEDTASLTDDNGIMLENMFNALQPDIFYEHAGAVPAQLVEDTLSARLPVYPWTVLGAFQNIYNEETDTYALYGGAGRRPERRYRHRFPTAGRYPCHPVHMVPPARRGWDAMGR